MILKSLIAELEDGWCLGDDGPEITAVVYDSRKVVPGALFVCIRGLEQDGHRYIPDAIAAGAAAVVAEQEFLPGRGPASGKEPVPWRESMPGKEPAPWRESVPGKEPVPWREPEPEAEPASGRKPDRAQGAVWILVKDTRAALARISAAWFGYPASHMTMIGLTGTKGKTTTAHMIKKILEKKGYKVGMIGTMGAFIGEERKPLANTTPESYELHSLFAQMLEGGCQYVVMEVSSQGLKQRRTYGIQFDYGVFLNISPDHIGKGEHKDFAEYLSCKSLLFSQSRHVVANRDDPHWREVIGNVEDVVTVSVDREADFCGKEIKNTWGPGFLGSEFRMEGKLQGEIVLNLPGRFNVENALAAAAVTCPLGAGMKEIGEALGEVTVKGRTQVLKETAHFSTFLIDYAHNALSMECLLRTLKEYHPGRLICLFGGGGGRPRQRRFDMGRIAGKYADLTVITMDNPRYEPVDEINADIVKGLEIYEGNYRVIVDREQAIRYLIDHCGRQDIVALIGKGHEEYQEIRGKRYYFSEEAVVASCLEEK